MNAPVHFLIKSKILVCYFVVFKEICSFRFFGFLLLRAPMPFFLCPEAFLGLILHFQVKNLKKTMDRIGLTTDREGSQQSCVPFFVSSSFLLETDAIQSVVLYFPLCAP